MLLIVKLQCNCEKVIRVQTYGCYRLKQMFFNDVLSCLGPLVFSPQKTVTLLVLNILFFNVPDEGYPKKRAVCTTFDIYVRIMCVLHSLIYYLQ